MQHFFEMDLSVCSVCPYPATDKVEGGLLELFLGTVLYFPLDSSLEIFLPTPLLRYIKVLILSVI